MTHVDVYTMANMYTVSCGISFFFPISYIFCENEPVLVKFLTQFL